MFEEEIIEFNNIEAHLKIDDKPITPPPTPKHTLTQVNLTQNTSNSIVEKNSEKSDQKTKNLEEYITKPEKEKFLNTLYNLNPCEKDMQMVITFF